MRILLIRHTSVDVEPGICYGVSDVPLKDTFIEEAQKVKEELEGRTFDKVFSSPLSRCTKLASFCGYANPKLDNRLKEMDFGDWEMQRWNSIKDPRFQEWCDDYVNVCPTGGKSHMHQREKLAEFLEQLSKNPYSEVAIFTHSGIIMNALVILGKASIEEALSNQVPYGGMIELTL